MKAPEVKGDLVRRGAILGRAWCVLPRSPACWQFGRGVLQPFCRAQPTCVERIRYARPVLGQPFQFSMMSACSWRNRDASSPALTGLDYSSTVAQIRVAIWVSSSDVADREATLGASSTLDAAGGFVAGFGSAVDSPPSAGRTSPVSPACPLGTATESTLGWPSPSASRRNGRSSISRSADAWYAAEGRPMAKTVVRRSYRRSLRRTGVKSASAEKTMNSSQRVSCCSRSMMSSTMWMSVLRRKNKGHVALIANDQPTPLIQIEGRLAEMQEASASRPRIDRDALMALAHDLPKAWNVSGTDARTKQRLTQILIHEVVIDLDEASNEAVVTIPLHGGRHTETRVARTSIGRYPDDRTISVDETAHRLKICVGSVHRLIRSGALPATQLMPSAPWQVSLEALDSEAAWLRR
jgi:hypothetical protein